MPTYPGTRLKEDNKNKPKQENTYRVRYHMYHEAEHNRNEPWNETAEQKTSGRAQEHTKEERTEKRNCLLHERSCTQSFA